MVDVLYLAQIIIISVVWFVLVNNYSGGIVLTVHSVFMVYFVLIPGYYQFSMETYPWVYSGYIDKESWIGGLLILTVYVFFYLVGYLFGGGGSIKKEQGYHWKAGKIKLLLVVSTVSLATVLVISQIGLNSFFSSREMVSGVVESGDTSISMFYALSKFSIFGLLILLLVFMKTGNGNDGRMLIACCLAIVLVLNLIVNNPISSPRFHFLGMILALLVLYGFFYKKNRLVALFFASPIFLYFIFPLTKNLSEVEGSRRDVFEYLSVGVDYDSMVQVVNVYRYVIDYGYSYGSNLFAGLAFFVPRSIWEEKPIHLGALSAEHAGFIYTNVSAPWPVELYYVLGYFSVVMGGLLTGFLSKKIDKIIMSDCIESGLLYGLSVLVVGFVFILMRGAFGGVAPMVSLMLVIYVMSYYFICSKSNFGKKHE